MWALAALLLAGGSGLRGNAAQPLVPTLFADPSPGAAARLAVADVPAEPDTLQSRAVAVNLPALDADVLDLGLFGGTALRARLDTRSANADGSESWSGRIEDEPLSTVTFVRAGALLQGSIRTLGAAYSIEPIGDTGLHTVRQVDLSMLGPELPPLVPPVLPAAEDPRGAAEDPIIVADDGSTFDVLVVYTASARTAAGGSDAAIQARITLGITETNTAYANSGVIPRLRLVSAEYVEYTESGNLSTDLSAVTGAGDGQMDGVHARRNALGADLVKLVVGSTAGGACGVAWLMESLSAGFAANAFSVTAEPCISPNYTFGHELGHNMGSNHAPDDPVTATPLYPYSFGYKQPSSLFRTVMAYNCTSGCPRVLYFSNPSVNYNGQPTGTIAQHNNALSINNARNTIANWRQAVGANTPPTITAIAPQVVNEDAATAALAFIVGDGQTAASSLVVSATSSNAAVVPNTPAALALGGSGANRTLTVTPLANASGATTITVTVSDGTLSTSTSFAVTVLAVNDPPVVSPIAAQITNEDLPVTVSFTVSDVDSSVAGLVVQASSANPILVGASGLVPGGSGASRQVTVTPSANQFGATTITVTVSDGMASTPSSFPLTVTPVNDAPQFAGLPPLVSTTAGVPVSIDVSITDVDTAGSNLTLSVTANSPMLPPGSVTITPQSATATSRTFRVTLTPAAGLAGSTLLELTAGDLIATVSASVPFNVALLPSAPDPPTTMSASASGTSVTFTWSPALTGAAATSFLVEIGTAPGTTTLPTQSVAAPATTLTLTLPAGTYYARVRAVNAVGTSVPSPEATVTVIEPSPIPGPPGTFSAQTTGTTVTFTWTAATTGAPATSYVLEAGSAPGLANVAAIDTGSTSTAIAFTNVPAGTYWVRIRGRNAAGTGAPSQDVAIVMGATSGCVGLPFAPVLLTPVVSGNNVTLSWNAAPGGSTPTNWILLAGSSAGASDVAVLSTDSTATSFAASAASGVYFVRVAGANACGVGPASNEVIFTLGADLPGTPANLGWTLTAGIVSLTWDAPASGAAPTSYLIEAGSTSGASNVATVSTGSAVTSYSTSAAAGTYFVRVRAVNGAGAGAPSNEVIIVVP